MYDLRGEMRIVSSIVGPETNTTYGNQRFNLIHTLLISSHFVKWELVHCFDVLSFDSIESRLSERIPSPLTLKFERSAGSNHFPSSPIDKFGRLNSAAVGKTFRVEKSKRFPA